ncbi:MAG: murein biosynthesis integral membrane protein MurJ [Anaerolineae bacterium]|nr:murein biosynthesis integral membrane protein MurJ [Anaerolineae bacterium]MDW8071378.1 murein biosynthesis integral membrane protein MurJ [Anaerolineae bacterium]
MITSNDSPQQQHFVRDVLWVGISFALAAGVGLLRNMLIAQRFGLGAELDAYYAAFKLPDLLFTVVAGGALTTAFIPVFVQLLATEGMAGAWRLASALTNLVVLTTAALAVPMALLAPWLVRIIIAPGFPAPLQDQTATLMRLVLLSTVIFGVSSVQSGALHGFKHFWLPALAPVVYPLGTILGALWLVPLWGTYGLAVGAVIGACMHLTVKIPALLHYQFRWWPVLGIRMAAVRRVAMLFGPRVLDLGVFHLTMLATTNLASRLSTGSVSALEWGWDAMQIPETIIGTAFGLVALPTLADMATRGDLQSLRDTLAGALRLALALAMPAACALIILGRPIVQLLYQRGAFDAAATEAVYIALRFYAFGLAAHVCLELVTRAFFACQDTVTPLLAATGSAAFNILLGIVLMEPLGHGGLALANSLAVSGEVFALLLILRRHLGSVSGRRLVHTLVKLALATASMAVTMLIVQGWVEKTDAAAPLMLLNVGIAGLCSYLICTVLLRVSPLQLARELACLAVRPRTSLRETKPFDAADIT